MSERFLIEVKNSNDLPVTNPQETRSEEGYLKNLTIEGILEILTGGQIKNTGEDYLITDEGLTIKQIPIGVFPLPKRNIKFGTGSGQITIYVTTDTTAEPGGGGEDPYFETTPFLEFNVPYANTGMDRYYGAYNFQVAGLSRLFIDNDGVLITGLLNTTGIATLHSLLVSNGMSVNGTTDSTSKDTGAIITEGGIGVEKSIFAGGKIVTVDTTDSTSTTTGAMRTAGGLGVAKNLHVGGTLVSPIQAVKFIEGLDSPYTVLSNDVTLLVDTSLSAVTLNLPTGTDGRKVTVKHIAGTASTESITINRAGSDTIEGNSSYTIDTDFGHVTLVFYAGVWYII